MIVNLSDIPSTGCVKLTDEAGTKWTMSRYELLDRTSLLVCQTGNGETLLYLDRPEGTTGKRWHVDASKYEVHPNLRVILDAREVLLEAGVEVPKFRIRG